MKPRKLRIMGLNSFIDEQEIEFSKLTEKGFFGIFGPTGSGKSTILDAITLAMYGKIPRSTNEFINTQKKDMFVCYEFEMGGRNERKTYSVERHIKRNKNGGYLCDRAILKYIDSEGDEIIAEGSDGVQKGIQEIIGLNCDDFTRSVVLPQGKFSDFLRLSKSNRGKMLERIFNLEQFGSKMAEKIKEVKRNREDSLNTINGALSRYDGITSEIYGQKKEQLEKMIIEAEALRNARKKVQDEYEDYKVVWETQEELKVFLQRKEELLKLSGDIENIRFRLSRSRGALNVMPFIEEAKNTGSRITASQSQLKELESKYEKIVETIRRTEEEYRAAYEKKDKELPHLIEKEANLREAIGLEGEIRELKKQVDSLIDEYRRKENEAKEIEETLKSIVQSRDNIQLEIEKIEYRIKEISITPEYREKIIEASGIEKEYHELKANIENRSNNLRRMESDIRESEKQLNNLLLIRLEMEKLAQELEDIKKTLDESFPGDNQIIFEMQNSLRELNIKITGFVDNNNSYTLLREEILKLKSSREDVKANLSVKNNEIEDLKIKINIVSDEILRIEKINLSSIIAEGLKEDEPCPVCGAVHHPKPAERITDISLEEKKGVLEGLKEKLNELQNYENKLKIELGGLEREITIKSQTMDDIWTKINGIDLPELQKRRDQLEKGISETKFNIDRWNNENKANEDRIKKCGEDKNKIELSIASIEAEIKKDKELSSNIEREIQDHCSKFEILKQKYETIRAELGVENIKEELTRISELTKEEDDLRKKQIVLRQKLDKLEAGRQELENRKSDLVGLMEGVKVTGSERRRVMNEAITKMNSYSDNRNPSEYINEVRNTIKFIRDNEGILKEKYEKERSEGAKLSEQKSNEEKNILTLRSILSDQNIKLSNALIENSFKDVNEVTGFLCGRERIDEYERKIKEFEENIRSADDNISRLNKKLDSKSIDEEKWSEISRIKEECEIRLDAITKEIAGEQKGLESMEKDLDEIKKLSKEKKEIEHTLSLLSDIEKLVSGNKFVEFAAVNQLKYISLEASKRLRDITRGRYALELDSNNEFVMRDDFSGGIRRSADTLSGGETFLTSLSLALALSSHIQLGNAPLEFFFLDEGFGTLDSELLEVVISSLERLRSERLSVGIISHVEELKNRVPVKLIVTPSTQEGAGTKVQIEYS